MKIEVIMNGERKELDLRGLKGKEIDSLTKNLMKMQASLESDMEGAYDEYMNKQKEYACKVSGLTAEELDDLDSDDRGKIFDYLTEKISKSMGFSKLLSR